MIRHISDLLYPPKCFSCKEIIAKDTQLCPRCQSQVRYVKEPACLRCGKPLDYEGKAVCYDCQGQTHAFSRNYSPLIYEGVAKRMMYDFKYNHRKQMAEYFGRIIIESFGGVLSGYRFDGIVPVPLHKSRQRQRGYNQAELIANVIGEYLGVNVYPSYLVREKKTRPQKELNDDQRKNNMKNAFLIGRNEVQLNQILLVDDIYTTGTTFDAAAEVLRDYGAREVICIAPCIGRGY